MRKLILLTFAILITGMAFADGDKTTIKQSTTLSSENNNVQPAFNLYVGPAYFSGFGVAIGADYEKPMLADNLTLGPGAAISYGRNSYGWGHYSRMDLVGNIVGHYYFDWLIPSMPKELDVFFNACMGLRFRTITDHYDNYFYNNDHTERYSKLYFNFESYIGGRWEFAPNKHFYAKFGYGTFYTAVGLSIKF